MPYQGRKPLAWTQPAKRLIFGATLALCLASGAVGCRTTADDVHRWAHTSQGPRKLIAVLAHDKYPMDLRVEAAMTLVRMKPRGGRRVGIQGSDDYEGLLDALGRLPPEQRSNVVAGMSPQLQEAILSPVRRNEDGATEDESFPYKDAAYALLTVDGGSLVASDAIRKALRASLIKWCSTNFESRMDESTQIYGMQQVLRWLKEDGVRALPALIQPGMSKNDDIARLVADLGDDKAKLEASRRFVAIAKDVASDAWKKKKAPAVEAANKASGLKPTKEQFAAQLDQYQEEELLRVFQSMQKVGQPPIVNYLLDFAQNKNNEPKQRASALAALEGHLDRKNPKQADAILALLSDDSTPDLVRDVAVKRVGELPREKVVDKLYKLFDNPRWQIRWVAADLILRMSDTKHIDEFMKKLARAKDMAMSEPLVYGPTMGAMKGTPKAIEYITKYAKSPHPVQARLTALGYYYKNGGPADIAKVDQYKDDTTKVPTCAEDATDCDWECTIQVDNKPVAKEVSTVGDFVQYCIEPAMKARAPEKKDEKKGKK